MIVSKYFKIDGKMYVEASDYDKILYELKNSNEKVSKIESELFEVQKSADEYGSGYIKINYCPMCGRKLVKWWRMKKKFYAHVLIMKIVH